ncbi:MAG: hypothetical protein Q8861_08210 [Bacteroidota bacterium]|nr:hypothetical protein [Bacteroidota bacterium]
MHIPLRKKYVLLYLSTLFLLVLIVFILVKVQISYSSNNYISKNYRCFFKDSVREKVDTLCNYSWVSDNDILTHFLFYEDLKNKKDYYELNDTSYNNYYFAIWDFKQIKNKNIEDIKINYQINVGNSDFIFGQTLDSQNFCSYSVKTPHYLDDFTLNVSNQSVINKEITGLHYKGFYGLIDRLSISDHNGKPQIFINFQKSKTPTIILIYKNHGHIFLIQINAHKKLNEDIIHVLNLQ